MKQYSAMQKLLVHLHVYYHEQVDYFISKLRNISSCEWDMLVTYSHYDPETEDRLRAFKSDTRFMQVENVGYDIWPFIKVLKSTGGEGYDFILKLHTKNTSSYVNVINGMRLKADRWRNLLVDSLLGSEKQFSKCWSRISTDPSIGFVYAYELKRDRSKGMSGIIPEARRISVYDIDGEYVSGTMFLARTEALKKITDADITAEMFAKDEARSHSRSSLAHIYEQLMCFAMQDAGFRPSRVCTHISDSLSVCIHRMMSPALKFIFSLEREGQNDSKVLTLFGLKIQLSKPTVK